MTKQSFPLLLTLVIAGCTAHTKHDRGYVSEALHQRTGAALAASTTHEAFTLPPSIALTDGLTADEAVALALWNNAQFQTDLTELGFARADLIEAGLLRNPMLSLLFPIGPKQLEYTLTLPLEALWQRPKRVAAAKLDAERVAENLVQHGLELARRAHIAHADLLLAQEHAHLTREDENVRREIAKLAAARLRAGDLSAMEESASRLEALRAQNAADKFAQEAVIARARLNALLGLSAMDSTLTLVASVIVPVQIQSSAVVLAGALAARPDLRAAELAIEAAAKRAGWERTKILNLVGVLDANGSGKEGFEMGPGAQMEIPLFNWNNGKTARAQAQVEQAAQQYLALKQRLALEVQEAYTNHLAAQKSYALWHEQLVPVAQAAALQAEKAFVVGEVSYLFVLELARQRIEARLREAEALAALRRAVAELKYSVGFHQ